MTGQVQNVLARAHKLGLRFEVEGQDLLVLGAQRDIRADFIDEVRQAKPLLLDYLRSRPAPGWGAVPPSDLPLRSAPVRLPPEQRRLIINFVSRQLSDTKLADWLCDRQESYYAGVGRHWDCCDIAFTSAVDLACWQLKRGVQETCELLTGFGECAATVPQPANRQPRPET